jgi:hypothetical protein
VVAGVVGQFGAPEERRSAFWFVMFGPLLMLAGQIAVHAAEAGDSYIIRVIGAYLLGITSVGVFALPKSSFVVGLLLSAMPLALGYGRI